MRKGFALIAPIRSGYGETGGPDLEDSLENPGGHFCAAHPDFARVALAASDPVASTLAWLATQPWADTAHVLVVGQSVGGLAAIAACARGLPGVIGCIDFSGGAGGNSERSPDRSCEPDRLADVYRELGRSAAPPSLWLYSENNHFWGPSAPRAWFDAFVQAGGSGVFVETAPVSTGEGHQLFLHGGELWGAPVNRFVRSLGL